MFVRILTGAILIPLVVALVWFAPPLVLAAVAALVSGLALVEFFNLAERVGAKPFRNGRLSAPRPFSMRNTRLERLKAIRLLAELYLSVIPQAGCFRSKQFS